LSVDVAEYHSFRIASVSCFCTSPSKCIICPLASYSLQTNDCCKS